jgi:hypothetical protein
LSRIPFLSPSNPIIVSCGDQTPLSLIHVPTPPPSAHLT